ncbi:MAG TPA: AAA family ATPase, partial [Bacilli bacterium]|nr:AAA family ATPase [Bacilli bacterium]
MNAPLAFRMRPNLLSDVLGQTHLVGPTGFLTNALNKKTLVSVILFGPPGCGKTTIAEAFARSLDIHFIKINAVTASKKELEAAMDEAKLFHPAIMIVDEVHRLPKDKQDLLLASIEDGSLYLFGATTENPYMVINPAMRSRCHLLEVKPLAIDDIVVGLKRAISDPISNPQSLKISDEALVALAKLSGGDLRFAYNALEILLIAVVSRDITLQDITETLKVPPSIIDQDGGGHYDAVSAMQKSIRGSDVDAALYYLARLIVAGDMESIRRRLLITAYEDVGLANPSAVMRAVQAIDVAKMVGFPEAAIPLGFTVCELALSPKAKTAADSIHNAITAVKDKPLDVLEYLKLTPVNMKEVDKYPYDRPDLWERMQYLPHAAKHETYYEINDSGTYLKQLNENYR